MFPDKQLSGTRRHDGVRIKILLRTVGSIEVQYGKLSQVNERKSGQMHIKQLNHLLVVMMRWAV